MTATACSAVDTTVVNVTFPCTLGAPAFGRPQPYVADSPAKAAYVDAVEAELGSLDDDARTRPVAALRLAGGASIMNADKVCRLVRHLRRDLAVEPSAQIAVDVEPLTVCTASLTDWTSCGVNRVNLGAWSALDPELEALGVRHHREQVQNALLFLEKFHVANVNVRLMFGLPGQTARSWAESLQTFAAVGTPHIEVVPLVEPVAEKAASLPGASERRARYEQACELLAGKGYAEYLPGRFVLKATPHARDGFEVALRQGAGLLGMGAGAASRCDGFLYENDADFDGYVRTSASFEQVVRNPRREGADAAQVRAALGLLDLGEAFSAEELAAACGAAALEDVARAWLDGQVAAGLVARRADGRFVLTDAGRFERVEQLGRELAL